MKLSEVEEWLEAGDMAVIGADDLEAGTHIFVKLRPCTIRKSTQHCPVRECYFESERQDVRDIQILAIIKIKTSHRAGNAVVIILQLLFIYCLQPPYFLR